MKKRPLGERFEEKIFPVPFSGCWLWTGYTDKKMGYGMIWNAGTMVLAHRASYEIYIGKIDGGLHVLHRCDVPCCVNPNHLFLGTNIDNVNDKVKKGRSASLKGEKHPGRVLTEKDVLSIRSDTESSHYEIAKIFGVDRSTVGYIKSKKLWSHVK